MRNGKNKSDAQMLKSGFITGFKLRPEFLKCVDLSFHQEVNVCRVINKQCENILAKSINTK